MKSVLTTLFIAFLLVLPSGAMAQVQSTFTQSQVFGFSGGYTIGSGYFGGCSGTLGCVAANILYIINGILVPVLFALAFIVFLYGVAKAYIFSGGEPEAVSQGHKMILWGIIGFVVMISLWGLVNVVANTFGLRGYGAPPIPNSYAPQSGAVRYIEQTPPPGGGVSPAANSQTPEQKAFSATIPPTF